MPKHRFVIQVRGCFWHSHADCRRAHRPMSNLDYWAPKLARTVARDASSDAALRESGWEVHVVWECEIEGGTHLDEVVNEIASNIRLQTDDAHEADVLDATDRPWAAADRST